MLRGCKKGLKIIEKEYQLFTYFLPQHRLIKTFEGQNSAFVLMLTTLQNKTYLKLKLFFFEPLIN